MTTPGMPGGQAADGSGASARPERKPYRLEHEPDGTSWTDRANLANILERELLGPTNGPHEILDAPPDVAYLVGRIAPVRLTRKTGSPQARDLVDADTGEQLTDVGDAEDIHADRGVPLTAVDDTTATADEDTGVEDDPQRRGLVIPASMGLRCQIPAELEAFTVVASWGVYETLKEEAKDARSHRRYQRTPVGIAQKIKVADLQHGQTETYSLKDKVVLRIDRFDDTARDRVIIEIALCNDREAETRIPVNAWLYQTKVEVHADGAEVFLPVTDVLEADAWLERDDELRRLQLQYRDRLEFAHGRTCSADWEASKGGRRASRVWTTWLPMSETPPVDAELIEGALLDMRKLAQASPEELREGLSPIVDGYAAWLDEQDGRVQALPAHLLLVGQEAVDEARFVHRQLTEGLELLVGDPEVQRCFAFMNDVMADQRVRTQVAARRGANENLTVNEAREQVLNGKFPHSWRMFQIAFILMQLPALTDPAHPRRGGDGSAAKAELLFFPTGGGKTEAYLGLAAYAFAIRRRQGLVATLDGDAGVTVLMRYTLRLLTSQQFQRAAALVCAAELTRRADPATWGQEPFRIGLWVGTDVTPKRVSEARNEIEKATKGRRRLTVLQTQRCPWCGTKIGVGNVKAPNDDRRRVFVYCGDEFAECPFAEGGEVEEGLPVLTTDEEIYRLAPAFLIATVDKFARLAREGEAASLFGYVSQRCDRHGFVHPDYPGCTIQEGSKHPAKHGLPAAGKRHVPRLRPPDLIIQDELHLITGSLGTTVGLFETAIDVMASWRTADGRRVRPLIVASTATARNAADQVRALYGRDMSIFPPRVLDAGSTFFSKEADVTRDKPGRLYVGLSTTGVRLTTAEIRAAEVLMAAGQLLLDRSGRTADPYMTLVSYFSATRELAGMTRYLGDDVQTALSKGRPWSALPRRTGTDFGRLHIAELTARVSSSDITGTLDQMGVEFDPADDSSQGRADRAKRREAGESLPQRAFLPFDAVNATSMLQVGVDVGRLGLMLVVGQPKNTAEYIQASSRVGRSEGKPGLVLALSNWARPRDLAHFEQFRHYHETFYAQVEALSVTPFSITSIERGLDGVLVSAARVLHAPARDGLSPEQGADRIKQFDRFAEELVDALAERCAWAAQATADATAAETVRRRLGYRLDQWRARRSSVVSDRKVLVYEKVSDHGQYAPLMIGAENAKALANSRDAAPFVVANSMREVQPEINLLVSPIEENLRHHEPPGTPQWQLPEMI
ncbi:DISARM system helicase DrmA [Nonomuraea sp. NPDC001684]